MKKVFSFLLLGAVLAVLPACEQKTTTPTTEGYQIVLITDGLEGATAKVSKTSDVHFADEVKVTVTPDESYTWETEPEVTASHAICKSSTEKDGVYTYIFTAFEDNSVIQVTGVASKTTGTHNNHDWVDLGLSSGTLWATCNVGATNPEDYGDYFAWGETQTKSEYNWSTYKYCNGSHDTQTKYCADSDYGHNGFKDNRTVLEAKDDAVHVNWGGDWRMPTTAEQQELLNECTWEWTDNYNNTGVTGHIVTGTNGNSIFLPAAGYRSDSYLIDAGSGGYYWSSSLNSSGPYGAYYLDFGEGNHYTLSGNRCDGYAVRPVCSSR